MSYFKTKMHQIWFRLGLRPRPHWGSSERSPRPPISGFKGVLLLTERYGEGMEKGKVKGGQKGEGREEWKRRGKGASWLCGMDVPGIRISNKNPKIFWSLRNQQGMGMRWRGIGGKARRGWEGAARKILRRGREVSKHGTAFLQIQSACVNCIDNIW